MTDNSVKSRHLSQIEDAKKVQNPAVSEYTLKEFFNMSLFSRFSNTIAKVEENVKVGPKIETEFGYANAKFAECSIAPAEQDDQIINRGLDRKLAKNSEMLDSLTATQTTKTKIDSTENGVSLKASSSLSAEEVINNAKDSIQLSLTGDEKKAAQARECLAALVEVIALMNEAAKEAAEDPKNSLDNGTYYDELLKRYSKGEYKLIEELEIGSKESFKDARDAQRDAVQARRKKAIDVLDRARKTKAWEQYQTAFTSAQTALTVAGAVAGGITGGTATIVTISVLLLAEALSGNKGKSWIASKIAQGDQETEDKWVHRLTILTAVATIAASLVGFSSSPAGKNQDVLNVLTDYLKATASTGQAVASGMQAKEGYHQDNEEADLSALSFDMKMKEEKASKSLKNIDKVDSRYFDHTKSLYEIASKDHQALLHMIKNR